MTQKLSFKEREWARREQEILAEAARLIREHGFNNLKLDDLADAVGISKPTLYQHFKNKDDLVAHVMMRGLQELHSFADGLAQRSPLAQLQDILRMMLEKRYERDSMLQGVNREVFIGINHAHQGFIDLRESANQRIYALVQEAQAQGEIDAELSPELISGLLFVLMGLPEHSQANDPEGIPEPYIMEQVIQLFTRAIQAR